MSFTYLVGDLPTAPQRNGSNEPRYRARPLLWGESRLGCGRLYESGLGARGVDFLDRAAPRFDPEHHKRTRRQRRPESEEEHRRDYRVYRRLRFDHVCGANASTCWIAARLGLRGAQYAASTWPAA